MNFEAPARARPAVGLLAILAFSQPAWPGTIRLTTHSDSVARCEKIEFQIAVSQTYTNPYDPDEVDVSIRFTTPAGQKLLVPAFWHQAYERKRLGSVERPRDWFYPVGTPSWRARFSPSETGQYEALAVLKDRSGSIRSDPVRFNCLASSAPGFIRVSRKDPRFLEFSGGQPFYAIGQNLAFIGDQQYVSLSKAEEIFARLSQNGANYLRIWTCCEDWAMAIEARKSAFGRSWDWHPQLAPDPDAETSGQKCLKISPDKNSLRVEPSHPVALRPNTHYLLRGQACLQNGVGLQVDLNGTRTLQPAASTSPQWKDFQYEFQTKPDQYWLPAFSFRAEGQGGAWLSDLSLKEMAGGPELLWEADVNRAIRGYYNPVDSFILDELVSAAEQKKIYLQLCLLTRDLYMSALKNPGSAEYGLAIKDARKTFRYAVARWGYSTSVAAWEYWNEMDPGLPTDTFYAALGDFLEQTDPYQHLRTTSTWGPSAKDCRHPKLDLADVHFYLRPSDKGRLEDEVDAVLERARWLREQSPAKPVHLGEFGLANEKWQPTDEMGRSRETADMHNALWASALSGASGTAMFWWWERLDQRDFYPQYQPLSRFLADVPWTAGDLQSLKANRSEPRVRVVGLKARQQAWVWLFNREAAWAKVVLEKKTPAPVARSTVELSDFQPGRYRICWWDTRTGNVIREAQASAKGGVLGVSPPDFTQDVACSIRPATR